jgi:hydrogenase nickel incorporation protein HypB
MKVITLEKKVLEKNDEIAARIRELLKDRKIFALNLISSPGAGKTTLLECTIAQLKDKLSLGVIEGDLQTSRDAERIGRLGVPVVQINTKGGCHLNAAMVQKALQALPLEEIKLLVIENVGNLVCPSAYDLGEDCKVVLLSVAEGDDKPSKYPSVFMKSKVMVINKTDLLMHTDFNLQSAIKDARAMNPRLEVFSLSCRTREGLQDWIDWLLKSARK